ncbi:DUF2914 domain-containing protein [Bdellovibrio bacteriovorus]|uniref:DUF2914 domain-containing protein n=1 Tax=Bdellovibrio bacteriovorus TaxID=959 RepID=UPI0035A696A5
MTALKERLYKLYQENEVKVDIAFFLGGFFFDLFTLSDIDNLFGIGQQVAYLLILGTVLYWDFLATQGLVQIPKRFEKAWDYRQLLVHFLFGSLLSIYSLFFIKSASMFSSIIFIVLLLAVMVANELQRIRKGDISIKIALFVICIFSFFSMTVPVLLGFVGVVPFLLSVLLTVLVMYGIFLLLKSRTTDLNYLKKRLLAPSGAVVALFLIFYFLGWIPPVPLSIQSIGVYHGVEKSEGQYILSYETPQWKFWHHGDQDFTAEPGDTIYIFAQIFSPARFSDSVILHWYYLDPRAGWQTTDKIPMSIAGGRKTGYRGFSSKQNYSEGRWRVSVETTDGREIGRIYFKVTKVTEANPNRMFFKDVF